MSRRLLRVRPLLAMAVACWAMGASAGAGEPVSFRTQARVEVDAGGKPVKIAVAPGMPGAIAQFVERRIAGYAFSPPERDGASGPAVTYLTLGACALPEGAGYRLAVDLWGNGPGLSRELLPPYPREADRAGIDAEATVQLRVGADGRARVLQVDYAQPEQRFRKQFDAAIAGWARTLQFQPEQLAGVPVATDVAWDVHFVASRAARSQAVARVTTSRECRLAAGQEDPSVPVAIDSPVKVRSPG